MKSLNEVIDKLEKADLTWSNIKNNLNYEDFRDALFYLKEYKKNQEDPDGDHQQLEKAQKLLWEFYQNDPLTWQELRGMEEKPVWVEGSVCSSGFWAIVEGFGESGGADYVFLCGNQFWKEDMKDDDNGLSWQAYRKER